MPAISGLSQLDLYRDPCPTASNITPAGPMGSFCLEKTSGVKGLLGLAATTLISFSPSLFPFQPFRQACSIFCGCASLRERERDRESMTLRDSVPESSPSAVPNKPTKRRTAFHMMGHGSQAASTRRTRPPASAHPLHPFPLSCHASLLCQFPHIMRGMDGDGGRAW